MKICDCCGVQAISKVSFEGNTLVDEQEFDVCLTHREMILEMLRNPTEEKDGRSIKNKDNSITS